MMMLRKMPRPTFVTRMTLSPTEFAIVTAFTNAASDSLANYLFRMSSISLNSTNTLGFRLD